MLTELQSLAVGREVQSPVVGNEVQSPLVGNEVQSLVVGNEVQTEGATMGAVCTVGAKPESAVCAGSAAAEVIA